MQQVYRQTIVRANDVFRSWFFVLLSRRVHTSFLALGVSNNVYSNPSSGVSILQKE
jgi:hypothetical protein